MKTNILEAPGGCHVEIRTSKRETFTEYHLTATVQGVQPAAAAARDLFNQLASLLLTNHIQPIQEKLYGRRSVRDAVLDQRDRALREHGLDRTVPATWIEGAPLQGSDFVGVQLWGVASHDGESGVETVENPIAGRLRRWRGRGFELLHLPAVRGTTPDGALAPGHVAQATHMFTNVQRALEHEGLRYTHVVRTWIYVARLLEWYDDLNRVRTGIYRAAGFGGPGGAAFPASTGIMGSSNGEECFVDVLALHTSNPAAAQARPILRSPRQDSSFNYGSAFSRGVTLEIEGRRTVHISGTASINTAGASTHLGDAEHQSLETLLSISAILHEQGGGLENIVSATLFCKDHAAWEAWQRVTRLLGIPHLPKVCVLADVCRHDLLVEMEAVAVI